MPEAYSAIAAMALLGCSRHMHSVANGGTSIEDPPGVRANGASP